MMKMAHDLGLIRSGVKMQQGISCITHLEFIDDTIVFLEADEKIL